MKQTNEYGGTMKTFNRIDDRELGTILASLRMTQTDPDELAEALPEYFAEEPVLRGDEIDALCERINTGNLYIEEEV